MVRTALVLLVVFRASNAFTLRHCRHHHNSRPYTTYSPTALALINLGNLFSGEDDDEKDSQQHLVGAKVSGILDSMQGFKETQVFGKQTEHLLQELSAMLVEGTSTGGAVKVVLDGQQRPHAVHIL